MHHVLRPSSALNPGRFGQQRHLICYNRCGVVLLEDGIEVPALPPNIGIDDGNREFIKPPEN